MDSNQKILVFVLFCFLGFNKLSAQITTSFSFGSIVSPELNLTSFSGPVVITGTSKCLDISNGVSVYKNPVNSSQEFSANCKSVDVFNTITYKAQPNPIGSYTRITADGINNSNEKCILSLFDGKGTLLMTSTGNLSDLRQGKIIHFDKYSGGIYLLKITTSNIITTIKLIKAS
jgi:hypothetical protein